MNKLMDLFKFLNTNNMQTYVVDAFTNKPFFGNPAGVCIMDRDLPDSIMQHIAREINHSETAFLLKKENRYNLRWFTPKTEVNLCGHATLATSYILYETGQVPDNQIIEFDTKSGVLKVSNKNSKIEMDFPQIIVDEIASNEIIEAAFNIQPRYAGSKNNRLLIEIDSFEDLINIKPDFQLLYKSDSLGFIITARSPNKKYDFYSRYFAPALGINEDPVTGSAHCMLAPYWGKKLNKKLLKGFQASSRTGEIECELSGSDRVLLRGNAVKVFEMKNFIFP
jgi:PhzF family phenazine biosynthesis protein